LNCAWCLQPVRTCLGSSLDKERKWSSYVIIIYDWAHTCTAMFVTNAISAPRSLLRFQTPKWSSLHCAWCLQLLVVRTCLESSFEKARKWSSYVIVLYDWTRTAIFVTNAISVDTSVAPAFPNTEVASHEELMIYSFVFMIRFAACR
jgi:uncharacterized membrane protein